MQRTPRAQRLLAAGIAAAAGFVDATGFLALDHYFVSFMSGNSTRLAVDLPRTLVQASLPFAIIVAFVGGVAAGEITGELGHRRARNVLLLVAGVLTLSAATSAMWPFGAVLLAAVSMGASNAVFSSAGSLPVGLTYMTGTLVGVGRQLATKFRGDRSASVVPYICHWLALIAGGVAGATSEMHCGLQGLWIAVVWFFVLAILAPSSAQMSTKPDDDV